MFKLDLSYQKVLLLVSAILILFLTAISSTSIAYIKFMEKQNKLPASSVNNEPPPEFLKAGNVGEVKDEPESNLPQQEKNELPQVVWSLYGTIKEVKNDRLIMKSEGGNFEDAVMRDLNAIYSAETLTITSTDPVVVQYQGLEGLKHLKIEDQVLVEGAENLRGKIEFKTKTVTISSY